MSFKFKPEDFDLDLTENGHKEAAAQANLALQTHLATLPRVYGSIEKTISDSVPGSTPQWRWCNKMSQSQQDTHQGILWGITEIEKNCEHVPSPHWEMLNQESICQHCGVKLKVKWEKA